MSETPLEFDPPLMQTKDGEAFFLNCQVCGARSTRVPLTDDGIHYCGICGEWGFSFRLAAGEDEDRSENLDLLLGPTWEPYQPPS